ncbi:hypothetical protein ACF0H5_015146 [Mactra antiquata]
MVRSKMGITTYISRIKVRRAFLLFTVTFSIVATILWIKITNNKTSLDFFYGTTIDGEDGIIYKHTKNLYTDKPSGVILVTYRRGGSSMLGEILQQSDDVFYIYEPLRPLYNRLYRLKQPVRWMNGSISAPGTYSLSEVHKQTMDGILTCRFSILYADVFEEFQFLKYGKKTRAYVECVSNMYLSRHDKLQDIPSLQKSFKAGLNEPCVMHLRSMCLNSKIRIIKTVRTPMYMMDPIYENIKSIMDLQVIHLIRDPRSIVLSASVMWKRFNVVKEVTKPAQATCFMLWNDTITTPHISVPVMTVYYEDIVTNPVKETIQMYRYVGMDWSNTIVDYAKTLVHNRNLSDCLVCKTEWHSSKNLADARNTIGTWKKDLTLKEISTIQFYCFKTLAYHGYQIFNQLQRVNASSKANTNDESVVNINAINELPPVP